MNNFSIGLWVKDTAVRTIKTMSQTALGVIGSTALISQVDWKVVASTVALSGVCCVLMNVHRIPNVTED